MGENFYGDKMASEYLKGLYDNIQKLIAKDNEPKEEYLDALVKYGRYAIEKEYDYGFGFEIFDYAKKQIETAVKERTHGTIWDLDRYCMEHNTSYSYIRFYYQILLTEARNMRIDSYFLYLEKNRPFNEKFYLPKRKQFLKLGLIEGLQDILDDKLELLTLSMPPGTGKTTLSKFFISGVMGWFPKEYNLFYSHSSDITRMYYDGVLAILRDSEYAWNEIFPDLSITNTNAKMGTINIGPYKPFQNLMTGSRGSELAGKVRASKFLMIDDLIGKQEEALNKNILDKIWFNDYTTDALQRKVTGCKEIHIATRWSVHDVIGRLQRTFEGNPRYRFLAVADIDEETGKSNFDYDVNGFDVEFFEKQAKVMDEVTYKCLYKNQPIEREGLLYHEDELRTFLELPSREPDAILAVCDTKSKGTDFLVMPIMYVYGNDHYLVDCICTDSTDYGVQYSRMANIILEHNVQQCEFESNAGGDRVAYEVKKQITERNARCNITTKPTETNKETRIIVNADWIKKNVLFKPKEQYLPKSDYGIFMNWLLCYSVAGKNVHDDVPDCLANYALYVTSGTKVAKVEAIANPFRMMGGFW